MDLTQKKCQPCDRQTPKLAREEMQQYLKELKDWNVVQGKLTKNFRFKNFIQAIGFINELAILAENEQHHPDFCLHYNEVKVTLWTHAIKALSENDFILAAKMNRLG